MYTKISMGLITKNTKLKIIAEFTNEINIYLFSGCSHILTNCKYPILVLILDCCDGLALLNPYFCTW
jgi:hypothetical protein